MIILSKILSKFVLKLRNDEQNSDEYMIITHLSCITKPKKPNSLEVGLFYSGSLGKKMMGNGKNIYFCRNLG